MAFIDLRPGCKEPGCRSRAAKRGYCADHQIYVSAENKLYDDHKRDKEKTKVYNSSRWRKLRLRVLQEHPLCTRCHAKGLIKLAQMVDHLAGFKNKDDFRAWDEEYLYPLCNQCHAVVTAMEKHYNFSDMPLDEAVYLKYSGAKMRENKVIHI